MKASRVLSVILLLLSAVAFCVLSAPKTDRTGVIVRTVSKTPRV